MNTERRRADRVRPKDPTYVALRPQFATMGKLLDISRTGLCFQYMSAQRNILEKQTEPAGAFEVDIFISNNGYYLPRLPCRLVYDTKVNGSKELPSGLEDRRCGLQFGRLVKKQTEGLNTYLEIHTLYGSKPKDDPERTGGSQGARAGNGRGEEP